MQKHIHLSNFLFFPGKEILRKMYIACKKIFATNKLSKLKKRQDKSNLLLCCPTLLYEITIVMKDVVMLHAAK
jgi:hypothetical protein